MCAETAARMQLPSVDNTQCCISQSTRLLLLLQLHSYTRRPRADFCSTCVAGFGDLTSWATSFDTKCVLLLGM